MNQPSAGFEIVEHTADVGILGWGRDLPELFAAMARGLFDVIAGAETVRAVNERPVALEAESMEDLLHAWLDELNTLHQIEGELYHDFDLRTDGLRLTATVRGEPLDPLRHDLRTEVKAVTWHDLRVDHTADGYEAYVLLDI